MRVLHVVGQQPSFGTLRRLEALQRELTEQDFEQPIVSLARSTAERQRLARSFPNLHYCGLGQTFDPTFAPRVAKHLRRIQPDVIHCWGDAANMMFSLANRMTVNSPLIVDSSPSTRFADCIVVTNTEEESQFHQRNSLTHVRCCPGGVDSSATADSVWPLAAELELPADSRFFAIVGDLVRDAGIEDAMWGFDLLGVIRQNAHLLVIGSGPHRDRLESFGQQMTWPHLVHFMGDRADLAEVLRQCVATLHANVEDGHPVLDAMAAGLPTIAVDGIQTRDRVVHTETGWLIPPRDPGEFARRVNIALDDPVLTERMGGAARDRAVKWYPVNRMISAYRELYTEMAAKHRWVA